MHVSFYNKADQFLKHKIFESWHEKMCPGKIQTSLPSIEAGEILISSHTERRYNTIYTVNYKGAVLTSPS